MVFKGSSESLTALLGSHIELVSTGAGNAAPHMEAGKLRILGVSSGQRLPGTMADVPTWKEQGVDLVYGSWRSMVGPKGLTAAQVTFWENALRKVVESADWKAELEKNYWGDFFTTGAEFREDHRPRVQGDEGRAGGPGAREAVALALTALSIRRAGRAPHFQHSVN